MANCPNCGYEDCYRPAEVRLGMRVEFHPDMRNSAIRWLNDAGNPFCLVCGKEIGSWCKWTRQLCFDCLGIE